jgi:hypothetical protein
MLNARVLIDDTSGAEGDPLLEDYIYGAMSRILISSLPSKNKILSAARKTSAVVSRIGDAVCGG